MLTTLTLGVAFLALFILLLRQLYLAVKEKLADRQRLLTVALLTSVLATTCLRPMGLLDWEKFEGKDVLIARRKGAANCMTTLKLKGNKNFTERIVCFGLTEVKGRYQFVNDTIYFEYVDPGRSEREFYKFAVIRPSGFFEDNKHFDLVLYKKSDTTGDVLLITKNELDKLKGKKPIR